MDGNPASQFNVGDERQALDASGHPLRQPISHFICILPPIHSQCSNLSSPLFPTNTSASTFRSWNLTSTVGACTPTLQHGSSNTDVAISASDPLLSVALFDMI